MSSPIRLNLLGLPPLEHALLAAWLVPQDSLPDEPRYALVDDWHEADLIVLDAHQSSMVQRLRNVDLSATVLLVGEHAQGTGWTLLRRPLQQDAAHEMVALLSKAIAAAAIDMAGLQTHEGGVQATGGRLTRLPAAATQAQDTPLPVPLLPPAATEHASATQDDPPASDTPHGAGSYQHTILLVGGRRLLTCTLTRALLRFGYGVEYAHDLRAAQHLLRTRYHYVVMLDASSLGRRTLPMCAALRRLVAQPQRLVVLANQGGMHQFLGGLVGCDAWLVKPLRRKQLKHYLQNHHVPSYIPPEDSQD